MRKLREGCIWSLLASAGIILTLTLALEIWFCREVIWAIAAALG